MSMFSNGKIITAKAKEYLGYGVLFTWNNQDILVLYNEISWEKHNKRNINKLVELGKEYKIIIASYNPQKNAIMGSIRHLDDSKNPVLDINEGDRLFGKIVNVYGDIGVAEFEGEILGTFEISQATKIGDEIYFKVLNVDYDSTSLKVEPIYDRE